jgi:hypothetical protein
MGIEQLEPFIGEWDLEAVFPNGPSGGGATSSFEWLLGGRFVVQRAMVPHPSGPDGFMVISPRPGEPNGFTQHYFDERGVVRVYEMSFEDRAWELLRVTPDFTPLDFSQRYTGTFSDDFSGIAGRWEKSDDLGKTWELDFELNYLRRG